MVFGPEGDSEMKVKGYDTVGNEITVDLTEQGHLKLTIEYIRPFPPANLDPFLEKLGITVTAYEHETESPTYLN